MNNPNLLTETFRCGTFGNKHCVLVPFALASSELIGATSDLVVLPRGVRVHDAKLWVTDAANASVTANIGLKSVSGTNQDDIDYFYAVQALSAVAFARKSVTTPPIMLAQDMYLRLAVAGADLSETCAGMIQIEFEYIGPV